MATIEDTTMPYEILIRFGEDGGFRGAHQARRRILRLDGAVVRDEILPPEPLSADGLGGVIDEATAAVLAGGSAAAATIARLSARVEMLERRTAPSAGPFMDGSGVIG